MPDKHLIKDAMLSFIDDNIKTAREILRAWEDERKRFMALSESSLAEPTGRKTVVVKMPRQYGKKQRIIEAIKKTTGPYSLDELCGMVNQDGGGPMDKLSLSPIHSRLSGEYQHTVREAQGKEPALYEKVEKQAQTA